MRGHRYYGSIVTHKEERHYEAIGLSTTAGVILTVGTIASLAGTAVSTAAAVQSSKNQAAAARAIQQQKETEAANEMESAAFEERQARRRTALLIGKQTAIQGAAGTDISRGTPLIQDIDINTQAELEALQIKRVGKIAAGESLFESRISKYQADTAKAAIPYEIGGGVLSGIGTATNYGLSAYSLSDYATTKKQTVTTRMRKG